VKQCLLALLAIASLAGAAWLIARYPPPCSLDNPALFPCSAEDPQ
jgi:hypothetical protein